MKESKHLHSTQLSTDSFTHMQWGEKLSDGRLFTLMAVGKPGRHLQRRTLFAVFFRAHLRR